MTCGLTRFGLPELRTVDVPPPLGDVWTAIMTGVASVFLGMVSTELAGDQEATSVTVSDIISVDAASMSRAYGDDIDATGSATVRLQLSLAAVEGDYQKAVRSLEI